MREVYSSTLSEIGYIEFESGDNNAKEDARLLREAAEWIEKHDHKTLLSIQLQHCDQSIDQCGTILRLFVEG